MKRRKLGVVILLSVVTLGIYSFFWTPSMSGGVNHVIRRRRFSFWLIFWVNLLTLGVGGSVFEVLYAYAIQNHGASATQPGAKQQLGMIVLGLNLGGYLIAFATAGIGILVSMALGIWSSWLIQDVINRDLKTAEDAD